MSDDRVAMKSGPREFRTPYWRDEDPVAGDYLTTPEGAYRIAHVERDGTDLVLMCHRGSWVFDPNLDLRVYEWAWRTRRPA